MSQKNINFNSLTPKVLDKNKKVYTDALNYAFSNSDIKNIAITGIYGSGKSTVWRTYCENKKLTNVITVSLGKYDEEHIKDDNRIERQLINQILSQIDVRKIPFSKYRVKRNIKLLKLILNVIMSISFLLSILMWFFRNDIFSFIGTLIKSINKAQFIFLDIIMLLVPIFLFLFNFYKENRFKLSKINLKGTEANFEEKCSDETVLDKDIKEIVYLLNSSKAEIIVFEDLDRYENIDIFTKLRELNFLLNSFIKSNSCKKINCLKSLLNKSYDDRTVRFVYMLKDGLFISKNRTKFFDFIVPIVPVVDSRTSENELIELFKDVENATDRNVLADISLYIDDMRLLKNIVNEYIVYSNIIPLGEIELERNKLFALITLKNIFPNEFDLLQEDKGVIRTIFDKLETDKKKILEELKEKLEKDNEKIRFINSRIENDKFEAMALLLPSDISTYYSTNKTMAEFLKDWSKNPTENITIKYYGSSNSYNYKNFIDKYILFDDKKSMLLEKLPKDFANEVNNINTHKEKIKKQIKDIDISSYKELLSIMSIEQREALFSIDGFEIIKDHYFPLIRFLIVDGLIDETYWYYKGNFDIDKSNTLKRNDIIYMKSLKEGKVLDIFLDVETPNEIISRLKLVDFRRFNILNKKILKTCLEKTLEDYIVAISDSVNRNNLYSSLINILDTFNLDVIRKYANILVDHNVEELLSVLEFCIGENNTTFTNILISILINKNIVPYSLNLFREYIEENCNIISLIPDEYFDVFIHNINSIGIKFRDLPESDCDKGRLLDIEEIQAYKIDIINLVYMTETILDKHVDYGELLNKIYQEPLLHASKNYIEENFIEFISEYINSSQNQIVYKNNEKILLKILNSDISEEYKIKYLEDNITDISDLKDLNDNHINENVLDCLLCKNNIKFSSDNIVAYCNIAKTYSKKFYEYLDRNLNDSNRENILGKNSVLCNMLINVELVSDKVFLYAIHYANKPIINVCNNLNAQRICILVKNGLVSITDSNIKFLLDNSYYDELVILVNDENIDIQDDVINILLDYKLSDDLIYKLVNSEISNDNSLKLIQYITDIDNILFEKISMSKKHIISYLLRRKLSKENIQYICKNFKIFELKDEFIDELEYYNELEKLDNGNLNSYFMSYVLSLSKVSISTKVSLILTKINNREDKNSIEKYILLIDEISDLVNVWKNKHPLLDNEYKEIVGEALIKSNYVKARNDKNGRRIMLIKKNEK